MRRGPEPRRRAGPRRRRSTPRPARCGSRRRRARREELRRLVVAELLQPGSDVARLVGLADFVERLGPGQHQAGIEQEVRRPLEGLHHRARMLGDGRRGVVGMVGEQDAAPAVGDALVERRGVAPAGRR